MILDCLARVIRTGRIKTASAAEQRAYGNLIQTQQRDQHRLHSIGARGSRQAAKRANRHSNGTGRTHTHVKEINLAPNRKESAQPGAARSRAPPCPAASRSPFGRSFSKAAIRRSAARLYRSAWTSAAANPIRRTRRGADENSRARSVSRDCASRLAGQTFCRRRARAGLPAPSAARRRRNASSVATGANEKRMRTHPF